MTAALAEMTAIEVCWNTAIVMIFIAFSALLFMRLYHHRHTRHDVPENIKDATHELRNERQKLRFVLNNIKNDPDPIKALVSAMTGTRWEDKDARNH